MSAIRHSINKVTVKPVYDYFEHENDFMCPQTTCDSCQKCPVCCSNNGSSSPHVVNRLSAKAFSDRLKHDNLGIQPPRRCKNCQNCKECSF